MPITIRDIFYIHMYVRQIVNYEENVSFLPDPRAPIVRDNEHLCKVWLKSARAGKKKDTCLVSPY